MKQFWKSFFFNKSVNHLGSGKNWTVCLQWCGWAWWEWGVGSWHTGKFLLLHWWRHFQDFKASQPQMLSTEDGKERELLCNKEWFVDTNEGNKAVNTSDSEMNRLPWSVMKKIKPGPIPEGNSQIHASHGFSMTSPICRTWGLFTGINSAKVTRREAKEKPLWGMFHVHGGRPMPDLWLNTRNHKKHTFNILLSVCFSCHGDHSRRNLQWCYWRRPSSSAGLQKYRNNNKSSIKFFI